MRGKLVLIPTQLTATEGGKYLLLKGGTQTPKVQSRTPSLERKVEANPNFITRQLMEENLPLHAPTP